MKPLILVLLMLSMVSAAKTSHAPLPQKLISAKSVFIDNRSGFQRMMDEAYSELHGWNRFEIVDSRDKADIVIVLDAVDRPTGKSSQECHSTASVLDPATDAVLWSNTRQCHTWHVSARPLIRDLRSRLEAR